MQHETYYVPHQSRWPIIGAIALFFMVLGAGRWLAEMQSEEGGGFGLYSLILGFGILLYMVVGWFKDVIGESIDGKYSPQVSRSFRQGMMWFIVSEVMFFAIFFGALLYARVFSIPWLDGEGNNAMTAKFLWPDFSATWPLVKTPDGTESGVMSWKGLPLINTLILITSSVTVHFAHSALLADKRGQLKVYLGITILLALAFLVLQVAEYHHAYAELGLRLDTGIYGNTFFMLTGFHGFHVTLGMIILSVVFIRILKGHFSKENHFAFEAASWYWHFVDVVWVTLFIFVYIV
jgi:cytochrome c oxidase subunit 3